MFKQLLQLAGLARKWPTFSREEVAKHNTSDSLWILLGDSVLDVTSLIGQHPGGNGALLKRGGGVKDCTEDLMFHGRATRKDAMQYKIGELSPFEAASTTAPTTSAATLQRAAPALPVVTEARPKVVVPADLHTTSHLLASDSEQWDDGTKDHALSSSDTDILVAAELSEQRTTSLI